MKSKYESHVEPHIEKIADWAAKGATIKEIAQKLNVAYSSMRSYLDRGNQGDQKYSALSAAFNAACEEPDDTVEASLYKKTQGYNAKVKKHYKIKRTEYDEVTGKKLREFEEMVEVADEVHVPADTNAIIFWLTNRRPDRWKHRPVEDQGEKEGETGVVHMPAVMDNPGPPEERGAADA